MHFEKGNPVGELQKEPYGRGDTGTIQKWKPDLEVFTEIDIPASSFETILKQQAIVNAGVRFLFEDEKTGEKKEYL